MNSILLHLTREEREPDHTHVLPGRELAEEFLGFLVFSIIAAGQDIRDEECSLGEDDPQPPNHITEALDETFRDFGLIVLRFPQLCQVVPSQEEYDGLYPGAGVWSGAVKEALQPSYCETRPAV